MGNIYLQSLFAGGHPWQGPFVSPKKTPKMGSKPISWLSSLAGAFFSPQKTPKMHLWTDFVVTLGSLGLPVIPFGRLGLPWDPGQHLDEQVGRISAACRQNLASWNLPGGPGGPCGPGSPGEVVS